MNDAASDLPENSSFLVILALGPTIWITHFVLTYVTASVWCAKFGGPGGSLQAVHTAVSWYTIAALAGIAAVGWSGYRRQSHGSKAPPYDFDSAADRHRFLGFATLLLAGLSAVATVFIWASTTFFEGCG